MNTSALAAPDATMKLGEINTAITPLTINAEGLRQFGFDPVGRERAAVLYRATDLPAIRRALSAHLLKAAA